MGWGWAGGDAQGAELTEAVDVWALGMLMWELMMEAKPWQGIYRSDSPPPTHTPHIFLSLIAHSQTLTCECALSALSLTRPLTRPLLPPCHFLPPSDSPTPRFRFAYFQKGIQVSPRHLQNFSLSPISTPSPVRGTLE